MNDRQPTEAPATESTSLAVRASIVKVESALTEFDTISAGLAVLREKYEGVVFPVGTPAGMKDALAARAEIRAPRYATEHARKSGKAPVIAIGKNLEEKAAWITDELLKIETPIDEQIKAEEARKEREIEAKETAERERIAKIKAGIDEIRQIALDAVGKSPAEVAAAIDALEQTGNGAWAQEFQADAEGVKVQTMTRLTTMHRLAVDAEAEAARLAAERAELERQKAEQREIERKAEVERQERAREEKKLMDDALARRVEEDRLQRERLAAEERAAKARIEAQEREARQAREAADRKARDELAAQEADLRLERERLEKERLAKEARDRAAQEKAAAKERAKREKAEATERERLRKAAERMDARQMAEAFVTRFGHLEEWATTVKAINAVLEKQPETA